MEQVESVMDNVMEHLKGLMDKMVNVKVLSELNQNLRYAVIFPLNILFNHLTSSLFVILVANELNMLRSLWNTLGDDGSGDGTNQVSY